MNPINEVYIDFFDFFDFSGKNKLTKLPNQCFYPPDLDLIFKDLSFPESNIP